MVVARLILIMLVLVTFTNSSKGQKKESLFSKKGGYTIFEEVSTSDTLTVKGIVLDKKTGEPLWTPTIILRDKDSLEYDGHYVSVAIADTSGHFVIKIIGDLNDYVLDIAEIGYYILTISDLKSVSVLKQEEFFLVADTSVHIESIPADFLPGQKKHDNIKGNKYIGQGMTIHCIDGRSIKFDFETLKKETVAVLGNDYTVSMNLKADIYGPLVEHNYDGLKLSFLDERDEKNPNLLYFFELTGSKYFLKIGDHAIKVGSHISTIKEGFPKSYKNRLNGGTIIYDYHDRIYIRTDDKGIIIDITYYIPS